MVSGNSAQNQREKKLNYYTAVQYIDIGLECHFVHAQTPSLRSSLPWYNLTQQSIRLVYTDCA